MRGLALLTALCWLLLLVLLLVLVLLLGGCLWTHHALQVQVILFHAGVRCGTAHVL
jgi:hypothetical protein